MEIKNLIKKFINIFTVIKILSILKVKSTFINILVVLYCKNYFSYKRKTVVFFNRINLYSKSLFKKEYNNLYSIFKKGNIILSCNRFSFSNIFLPSGNGLYHASFFINSNKIVSMQLKGFTVENLKHFCLHNTRIVILECPDFTKEYIDKIVIEMDKYKDYKYNWKFKKESKNIMCCQLITKIDIEGRIILKKKYVDKNSQLPTPECFLKSPNLKLVYDTQKSK